MKTVLLTGASGFIGRHCIPSLIKHGYEVHALTTGKNVLADPRVSWHTTDLLNPQDVHEAMETICPTHLMHFAWYTLPSKYWNARENIQWLQASLNLVQEFSDSGGERMVGAGTCAEYDLRYGYCSEDLTPLKPQTLYGISKQSCHLIGQEILKAAKVSNAWGRIFFLYGPYENKTRLVPSIINS
jgi:nucleoside-diphosphate-sugar epimerase